MTDITLKVRLLLKLNVNFNSSRKRPKAISLEPAEIYALCGLFCCEPSTRRKFAVFAMQGLVLGLASGPGASLLPPWGLSPQTQDRPDRHSAFPTAEQPVRLTLKDSRLFSDEGY